MRIVLSIIFLFSYLFVFANDIYEERVKIYSPEIKVYFSPKGGAQEAIIATIANAKTEILVMAYSFTAKPIADALIKAYQRGVSIKIILDKSQPSARAGKMQLLVDAGIAVYIDNAHAIAHNKVIIIDGHIVITGSYNFSRAAEERNAENILLVKNAELARIYTQNFIKHKLHSQLVR